MKKSYMKAIFAALILASVQPALAAEEKTYPQLSGEISIEVENDNIYSSDDQDNELNDLYLTVDTTLKVNITEKFSIGGNAVFEPVLDPQPSDDRAFEDNGLYIESLVAQWDDENFSVYGGKFTPVFGIGWDRAAGIYGADFAEDYQVSEQIGLGGSYTVSSPNAGEHTVSLSTFYADTTSMSDSIITRRGRTRKSAGGVGNTEDLSSFAIALDGGKLPGLPDLSYHLAYMDQGDGETETENQTGVACGLEYPITFSELTVTPLVEFVHFNDADGSAEMERRYWTTSLAAEFHNYNLAAAYSSRSTEETGAPDIDDELFQLSAGYAFENGLSLDAGWKTTEEEGVDSKTFGLLIAYSIEF